MLYAYVCEVCSNRVELLRPVAARNDLPRCPLHGAEQLMRREVATPTVHYKGAGWTRTPPIMNDPIAANHPGQRSNWGAESAADYGDPNQLSPYKKVVPDGDED